MVKKDTIVCPVHIHLDELKSLTKTQAYKLIELRCEMAQHCINDLVDTWYKKRRKKNA